MKPGFMKKFNLSGGKVISIERRSLMTGPFFFRGKGTTVYHIDYEIGNRRKEGWVKFGGFLGPDWRL
ncbi:MAG: hypothetical protein N2645_13090 [Clostridia bacterium]|nr:hypothetical protein [Clostridia bacterium]